MEQEPYLVFTVLLEILSVRGEALLTEDSEPSEKPKWLCWLRFDSVNPHDYFYY